MVQERIQNNYNNDSWDVKTSLTLIKETSVEIILFNYIILVLDSVHTLNYSKLFV